MAETHPEVNHVIQLAAGIANVGHNNRSTAAVAFTPLRLLLGKQLHMPVLAPVVPSHLGLFGSNHKITRNFHEDVEKNLEPYPNARVLFIAHSFGGLLSREWGLSGREARDRYIGTITLGTPHLGTNPDKWPQPLRRCVKNMNEFAADVRQGHHEQDEQSGLAMIATTLDYLVPCESALPAIPRKERHLFTRTREQRLGLGAGVQQHFDVATSHNLLMVNPVTVQLTARLAIQLVKEQSGRLPVSNVA